MRSATISKRPTIVDIAQLAGVTPKTVSRALNDAPHVSEAVRRRVKEAAATLDYHPNLAAQSLIARRSFLIGLTYEHLSPGYVVELQNGALDRLGHGRYRLAILPFGEVARRPTELGAMLMRAGLDGVLLAPPACDQPELLDMLERQKLPYARITPHRDLNRGIVATMDEVAAARTIAEHVLSLGHRRVGIILGDPTHAATTGRMEGYRQAFAAAGVPIEERSVVTGNFTFDAGYQAARELLARGTGLTAILAQNDDMAVAAIGAAYDLGLAVPGDLSIAGFDNSKASRTAWPQVTTVHQPVQQMAWDAADRLIALLDGTHDVAAPTRRDHAHELRIRASTAPVTPD